MTHATPLIQFDRVSKYYGECRANDELEMVINHGTIHAIIGENGAGKSTAMRMLYGMEPPTAGRLRVRGKDTRYRSSRDAMHDGIGMVHQHFMLSPVHSALDNVLLATEGAKTGIFSLLPKPLRPLARKDVLRDLEGLSASVDFRIPWTTAVGELPVGTQQQIEIMKLLYKGVEIMIFDEPTAVLSPLEIDQFMKMLVRLKAQGKTIIIITHKLGEVKEVSDTVTIMRKGRTVATRETEAISIQELADLMVGRKVLLHVEEPARPQLGAPVLTLEHVTLKRQDRLLLQDLNVSVRSGEIVGVAGVEGNGQNELLHLLYDPAAKRIGKFSYTGTVSFGSKDAQSWAAADVRASGVGVVAADRQRESVLLAESLSENNLLGHLKEFTSCGVINRKRLLIHTKSILEAFDVRPSDPFALLGALSGGNQQKFVMARELLRKPNLLLCAQPTRGVDVGSIEQIHRELIAARTAGMGILLVSSQLDELMQLADRLIVMCSGRIVAEFNRSEAPYDKQKIGVAMGGGDKR